ncbi:stage II sporulation protein M [uncultured Brevundimonas sp.]|uniref:stage II sporulation protein M n=1 Tax=uncultured Brevundimonas sp. TaxID=213418 RepID=UPI0025EE5427|nr:stage II sporulation protein M [uncultured Brevundimonas sp.]
MSELQLKSQRFRTERERDWRQLEALVTKAEKRSASALSNAEILAMPVLYRSTLSALSVARETSLDQGLIGYLESLSARAYFFVYGARSTPLEQLNAFFSRDWPKGVQSIWLETLVALFVTALGAVVAYVLVGADSDWFFTFVDPGLAQGRDPTATQAALRATLYDGSDADGLSFFATYLFTHNAEVALLAFALGFAFGVPTIVVLLSNGAMLGAMIHVFVSKGLGYEFGGWLMVHGVTELFAIVLAGAAGLRIGWAVAFPGRQSRLEAMSAAGKAAGAVMMGVVIMLMLAGVLEGFGRQLITSDTVRYAIAAGSAALWGLYFYAPRPDRVLTRTGR